MKPVETDGDALIPRVGLVDQVQLGWLVNMALAYNFVKFTKFVKKIAKPLRQ